MRTYAQCPPESWDTIPGVQLLKIAEAYGQRGTDVAPSFASYGIDPNLRPDSPVEFRRAMAWIDHVLDAHRERGLGLMFHELMTPLDSGMVGYAIISSDTVGEAISERVKFSALLRPYFGLQLRDADHELVELAIIEPDPPVLGARAREFCMERDLASWVGAARRFVGPGRHIEAVDCAYPDPLMRERYHEVFGCPVRFDQPQTLIRLRREVLDMPLRHAHGEAHRLCEAQCETLLAQMRNAGGVATAVRRLMLQRPRRLPGLEQTAAALELSPRTLRRRLQDEGVSFTELLAEVRMTLARDYLRTTPLPIANIASLLGYVDESSFGRAFRRTLGLTPRGYRTQARLDHRVDLP